MPKSLRTEGPNHDVTDIATDVRVVAPADVREFVAARGGRLFVWITVHPGWRCTLSLLETAFEPPTGDLYFRRVRADGFDLYLEARQRFWPVTLELSLRLRRVVAYWNGLAWIV